MMEMTDDTKAVLETAPEIVQRIAMEVMRIHNNGGPKNEAEEDFLTAVLEHDAAMRSGRDRYAMFIFGVLHCYLYESPEKALEMVIQRAAEIVQAKNLGGQA